MAVRGCRGLVVGQGGGAVWQGCARRVHGVDGFQAPLALLRVRGDPHLVVVATFQHDHGNGAGVTFAWRGPCACRLCSWWVPLNHAPEVVPLIAGCLAFPVRGVYGGILRLLALGCRGGPFPAPGAGRGAGVCRWRYKRLCPTQV